MQRRSCHVLAARPIASFGSRTSHQAVRPRRGRFPVIGSSPHWPGGTGISNLRPLAGWISALERGRFQGYKQKRKLKSVAPFARNRKFESISLQRRVWCEPGFRRPFAKLWDSRLRLMEAGVKNAAQVGRTDGQDAAGLSVCLVLSCREEGLS